MSFYLEFPYYIVRFKQIIRQGEHSETKEFPYYIVRFKPVGVGTALARFVAFPYYIVRFKLSHLIWCIRFRY